MKTLGFRRYALLLGLLAWCALFLAAMVAPARSGTFSTPIVLREDTLAVGMMDSTTVVDMSTWDDLTLRFKGWPPAGGAEPQAVFRIRAVGSMSLPPDSNSTGLIPLRIVADQSSSGSAAGDSVAYGFWNMGNSAQVGNAELKFRAARPNSKWPYPAAEFFSLGYNGTNIRYRYVYFQIICSTAGGPVSKYRLTAQRWVK